jgi:hypothetical protein
MSQRAPAPRPGLGPRYYRQPPLWGLVGILLIVLLVIFFLLRIG